MMRNKEAQRLLGNGSNTAAKDLPTTDSKTTTTKKGYMRLSVALGTCAVLLLGVVFCADRGGGGGNINTNLVHNTIRSSGTECDYCTKTGEYTDQRPADMKRGMCDTSGIYDHVLPFLHYQQVIPGKIYYGLDFTDSSYKGMTYTPHNLMALVFGETE